MNSEKSAPQMCLNKFYNKSFVSLYSLSEGSTTKFKGCTGFHWVGGFEEAEWEIFTSSITKSQNPLASLFESISTYL